MKRWWVRDVLLFVLGIGVLIGLQWGLQRIPINGIAYYYRILILIGINIILAVSLNIINGHAGQFSMGHAGFMAIGAYASAFLTYYYAGPYIEKLPEGTSRWILQNAFFLGALLVGGLAAAIAGYLVGLPSLRLRGDYLAIVTLGFGEIIRVLILNVEKLGAARGMSGVPAWGNFFWVFLFAWITVLVSMRLVNSSVGRAFLAVREDEIAAEAMGVDTTHYKVQAFVIGSFFAGIAGALFGHYLAYLNPSMFQFTKSFEVIAMVVLGGMGSISGSILAAILLTFLPEGLRMIKEYIPTTSDPRMVIYSIMLIVLMLTRPQGLLGRRELWEVLARRKDSVKKDSRDEDPGKMDRSDGPAVKG
ncbi:MAG TPA: branched-chain amino acid ABC transporter permease [Thermoanaerobaculia bacterium]|nr:branched-chain amino acid ABC transporter permease [Thermoanaerobaculia bacterium]